MVRAWAALLILVLSVVSPVRGETIQQLSKAVQEMVPRVAPAVVHISVTGYGAQPGYAETTGGLINKTRGGGSGVILDPDGYILTNAHVVEGARRVQVVMQPPRPGSGPGGSILKAEGERLGAQIIGIDHETDLAVLKVQRKDLPYLELADSDDLRQGELVFAFGSPFGLENSVTMGIVSNVSRQLRPEDRMIYIQTDATINPGNSGGPLVNARGMVVGINTLIFTASGGSEGIGFAAPANIVGNIFNQFRTNGRVRRGQIGVHAQTITPVMATAMHLPRDWGVILGDVYPGGPAERAGLMIGDIVVSLDGKTMENGRQLDVNLYRHAVGGEVTLEILRGGEKRGVKVGVVERHDDSTRFSDLVKPDKNLIPKLGILAVDLDPPVRELLPPLRVDEGVVIAGLSAQAPMGSTGGFQPGDVLHTLNQRRIDSVDALRQETERLKAGDAVVCQVERMGRLLFVAFELD